MPEWTTRHFVVVDIEGNGQQPPDLVELAAVPIIGGIVGEPVSRLVKPESPITHFATRIHGLTNHDVADCPPFDAIKDDVLDVFAGSSLVAHNAHVDIAVLSRKLDEWARPEVFDTLKLARRLLPGLSSYRLSSLAAEFTLADGLPAHLSPHRATYDALVAARLFVLLAGKATTLKDLRGHKPEEDEHKPPTLF